MDRDRNIDRREGQPVEPGEAKAHGNDSDAVLVKGSGNGEAGRRPRDEGTSDSNGEASREERGDGRENQRGSNMNEDRGTSFPSVIFGWLAALGATPILFAIIGAIVGGIVALLSLGATTGGIASSAGFLIALFLVFLIGGYVAGRLASRQGLKHGLLVPLLALILVVLLSVAGGILGSTFSNILSNAIPSGITQNIPTSIPQGLGITAIISGILALLMPFLGGSPRGTLGRQDRRTASVTDTLRQPCSAKTAERRSSQVENLKSPQESTERVDTPERYAGYTLRDPLG